MRTFLVPAYSYHSYQPIASDVGHGSELVGETWHELKLANKLPDQRFAQAAFLSKNYTKGENRKEISNKQKMF